MSLRTISLFFACLSATSACAQDVKLEFESGSFWQTRNTNAVPAKSTKFSYRDLLGRGPFPITRTTLTLHPSEASGYRFVWAPIRTTGTGQLDQNVTFNGQTFAAGTPTYGEYMFNSYRATWWKRWRVPGRTQARAGYTLFVRDARVTLAQGGTRSSFYNLGFVPLAYVAAQHDFSDRAFGEFEFDGFLSPYGGAIDTAISFGYRVQPNSALKFRLRALDGGTSRGKAYSFATLVSATVGFEQRW